MAKAKQKEVKKVDPQAEAKMTIGAVEKAIAPLIEPMTRQIVVRDREDCELASRIMNNIPLVIEKIENLLELRKRAADLNQLWKDAVNTRNRVYDPLLARIDQLRHAITRWQMASMAKAERERAKKQATIDDLMPEQGIVVQSNFEKVEGLTAPVSLKRSRVVDFKRLVEQVASGDVPLDCLSVNEKYFTQDWIKRTWPVASEVDGKRYVWQGVVELYEEFTTRRS